MKKTARVIITLKCERACSYCCNKYEKIIKQCVHINNLKPLRGYKEVIITGGEPMLNPSRTLSIIRRIKRMNPKALIYLYTAKYDMKLEDTIELVDGVQYTLHSNSKYTDFVDFEWFQLLIHSYRDKSFRLYIHNNNSDMVRIIPNLWKEVRVKAWTSEKDCKLPEWEDLYILADTYFNRRSKV